MRKFDEMNLAEMGRRIAILRELHGWPSQRQFAKAIGINPHTVSTWERGRSYPMPADLLKLREALQCTTDFLLCGDPSALPRRTLMLLVNRQAPSDTIRRSILENRCTAEAD